jgi:hypothetical protein
MYALRISQLISVFLFVGALLFMVWCWYYQRSGVQQPEKE